MGSCLFGAGVAGFGLGVSIPARLLGSNETGISVLSPVIGFRRVIVVVKALLAFFGTPTVTVCAF